ncbi:adenylate/guanylate cyclase domain-containing protein, partial [Methylobacterium sp. GC_Met_2]|uniref:adenylate/guanylate cyclase domain-containing protein n=1 Tax=Methylobacterium sp. GC_Met_2 TaxID=2937376 RepID=UPI0031F840E7
AILVADIVGYSRIMGLDEAGTIKRLKALRRDLIDPATKTAQGRIVKTMGDGLLVEFPSPLRAVSCAVRIQRAMANWEPALSEGRRFKLRFGINVGDVVAQPDGDLFGDGVNVAARLEPLAEPGGLCVSRSVHEQVRDKLAYRFEDKGKLELKNIARPIGVFALSADAVRSLTLADDEEEDEEASEPSQGQTLASTSQFPRRRGLVPIALAATVVVAVAGSYGWSVTRAKAPSLENTLAVQNGLPPKPLPPLSLVVLPFANLSNDPDQEYFADGLTEDLTTDLSHLAGSFVIARNTAFTYKGKAVDVKQVGRDLGVRYALEGSVRRTGEHVVLNAQLISTETGAHIWADRCDGERSRLGEIQAEFVARLARSLDVQLSQAEGLRVLRDGAINPTAADLNMLGWAAMNRARTPANTLEARSKFEQSLSIDVNNPQAKIGLARAISQAVNTKVSKDTVADSQIALKLANEGLAANPQSPMAHYAKAEALRATKDFELGLCEIAVAVEYNPNMAIAHALAGITELWNGKAANTFGHVDKAIRLSPKDPLINAWEYYICHAHTHLKHWDDAINWCNKSVGHVPYYFSYIDLAVAHA